MTDQIPPQSSTTSMDPPSAPAPAAPQEELIDIELFAKIKLRVGTILSVEAVPKSKKLYKLQVDLGTLGQRQILSGIALHYTPEQLVHRQVVVIANLKTARLMGLESQGMILAASTEGDGILSVLQPDKAITSGSTVR